MTEDKYFNIPTELRDLPRWVGWRIENRDGKPTKVPVNIKTGGRAMSNTPSTWGGFESVLHYIQEHPNLSGIGFMLGDGYVGIDIDDCWDDGSMAEHARDIVATLNSFTESSPSGQGLHVICKGKLPEGRRQVFIERPDHPDAHLGIYDERRFFCMTGQVLDDGHTVVEERSAELAAVHEKYVNVKKQGKNDKKPSKNVQKTTDFANDDDLIEKAMVAKNGSAFSSLMRGVWEGLYASQSEADLALCNMLAFWCRCDAGMMDRIFRRSGFFREKWDQIHGEGGTYGQITIRKAIQDCGQTYEPGRKNAAAVPEQDLGLDQLGDPPPERLPGWIFDSYHDMWNAERLKETFGDIIRFNVKKGWHIYTGTHWKCDELKQIRGLADQTIVKLYQYQDLIKKYDSDHETKKNKAYVTWLSSARNASKKDAMIREAEALDGIAALPEWFDKDKFLLNCRNGTLDLRTGELHPHNKDQMITRIIDIDYDPDAKTALWDRYLERIFDGKKELIEFIQRAIGYTLTGSIKEQCIFILYGVGKNGKSTFVETVRDIFGDYVRKVSDKVFTSKDNYYNSMGEIARLPGARMVTTDEPKEGAQLEENMVKQISGGAPLLAKYLYKEPFEFMPEFKLWMEANHKPIIKGTDLGIWRRIRLVPFNVVIPVEERDTDLLAKLKSELPGILAWIVRGCLMWQKDGMKEPQDVIAATDDYKSEMDMFQTFLDECLEKNHDGNIRSGDLYNVYSFWCAENGTRPLSSTKLAIKLQDRGYKKDRNKLARYWEGVELTEAGKSFLHKKYEGRKLYEDRYDNELPIEWQKR